MTPPIDIRAEHLRIVQDVLRQHLPNGVKVWVFGSRASWMTKDSSDLDLALEGETCVLPRTLSMLEAAFEESDLPFGVDIVDISRIGKSFRQIVAKQRIPLPMTGSDGEDSGIDLTAGSHLDMADGWVHCTLADACSNIDYGLTASASKNSSGSRFLRITDIVSGHLDWNNVPYVSVDDATAKKYRLHSGDIVVARTGASTGASMYIKKPPPAVFASYLVRLQAKSGFDSRFLAYYLKSPQFWGFIRGVLGDKSAQPNASASTMSAAPLRAPRDKTEQRAIAHILGTLDDKIELNRRMNETLEAMARALFKSWFVDFDPVRAKMEGRDTGLPKHLADLFPDRLVDSELGEIPEGWGVKSLEMIAQLEKATVKPEDYTTEEFEHFSLPAYDSGQLPALDLGSTIKSNKTLVPSQAVLLSKLNPEIQRVWLPASASSCRQISSTEFLVFTPKPPIGRAGLYSLFNTQSFRDLLKGMVTGTSKSHQRVAPKSLAIQAMIVPADRLAHKFEGLAWPVLERTLRNKSENHTLTALRDTLLPKLISGELRVKDAEQIARRAVE